MKQTHFIKRIFSFFDGEEKRSLRRLFAVIVAMGFVEVIGVLSIAPFMALAANPGLIQENPKAAYLYHLLQFHSNKTFLIFLGVVLLGIFLFNNLFSVFATWLILRFSAKQKHRLSTKMLAAYLYKPYRFYLLRNSADLSKNILVECTALAEGIILPAMQGLAKLVSVVLICLLLIVVNPILAGLVGLTFGGSYLGVYLAFYRRLGEFGKKRLAASTQRFKITGEAFGGVKEVKAKGHESHFTRRFAVAAKSFAQMVVRNQMITQLPRYLLETVAFGGLLMITLYLILTQPNFSKVMSLLALYALAGYRLMPSLQQLYLSITTIRFNKPIVDVVYADLKDAEDLTAQSDSLSVKSMPFARSIDLQQLSFTYEGAEQSAINNFNLSIPKGANIAFVGHTGAGKTTIVDLILGLLTPTTGQISVDGKVLTANNRQAWQQIIGYIPQEIFLCDGTVAENIAFGTSKSKIDLAQVQRVAKVANLHDFVVNDLPLGYETVVGEKGVRLSGGQRQRIGIARAIYDNPDILVLDEATSALDGITEEAVLQAIHALSKQKTLITIAHRLATVKSCDQIYLLEAGNIVDQGSYQELIARNKTFKAMAREQTQQETIS